MKSVELREARMKLVKDARDVFSSAENEKREMTGEEQVKFDAMMDDAKKLADQIATVERKEQLEVTEAELRAKSERKTRPNQLEDIKPNDHRHVLRDWALYGTDKGSTSSDSLYRAGNLGVNLASPTLSVRALSKGTNTAGGHTVPVGMSAEIEKKLRYYIDLRNVCGGFVTENGQDFDYPRVSDGSNAASVVAEAGNIGVATDPTFDKVTFKAWHYRSPIVKVSKELLADSVINLEELLADLFVERMAVQQEADFVTGDGTTEPEGLVTGAATGVSLASGNAITIAKILDLIYSVSRAYRQNGSFLMHDNLVKGVSKLTDSAGQYLWEPSVKAGEPDRLKGYPVYVSNQLQDFDSPGDDATLALFGDMTRYKIRDIPSSMELVRMNELYAGNGQVGFLLSMRCDGRYTGHSGCVVKLNSYNTP